ncbi:phospholipase D-like domain-containing protein [Patescibacteria group bacterium]
MITMIFASLNLRSTFALNQVEIDYEQLQQINPSEKIQAFFNKGVDTSYKSGNSRSANGPVDFRKIITNRINNTQSSINLAVMYIEDKSIIDALKAADKKGINIRIIVDQEKFEILKENLKDTNIEVKDNLGGQIQEGLSGITSVMHYKFAIFDHESVESAYLLTGSANWMDRGFDINSNSLLQIQDQALSKAYLDEFEQMWQGKFNRNKDLSNHRGEIFEIDGRIVELWMSPSVDPFSSFEMRLVNLLKKAEKSIDFAVYTFSLTSLSETIEKKYLEGIDFKGIVNNGIWVGKEVVTLSMQGITEENLSKPWTTIPHENLRHDAVEGDSSFHYKTFIIDDEIVVTGASNPTVSAIYVNDEDLLIIHDPLLANEFTQNFYWHFDKYGGLTKDSKVKIENFDDENDTIEIKNLSNQEVNITNWKITSTVEPILEDGNYEKKEFVLKGKTIPVQASIKILLPNNFINDNHPEDKFPIKNSQYDGEIYLFDENDLLQHMVWY